MPYIETHISREPTTNCMCIFNCDVPSLLWYCIWGLCLLPYKDNIAIKVQEQFSEVFKWSVGFSSFFKLFFGTSFFGEWIKVIPQWAQIVGCNMVVIL